MRSSRTLVLLGLLLTLVGLPAPLTAQEPPCRDCIRIEIDAGDGTMRRYSFWGTGTHRCAKGPGEVSKAAPKSGAFENGIYTCWDPQGWKHVEIAFAEGVKLTTFDAAGKPVLNLRSQGLPVEAASSRITSSNALALTVGAF